MAKKKKQTPTVQVTLPEEQEQIVFEQVLERIQKKVPSATRASVARAAMWLGLPRLWRNPALVATVQAPHVCEGDALVAHGEDCPHNG